MRASAQWYRRLSERFSPREARRGVVHLRHYPSEYLIVGSGEPLVLVPGLAGGYELLGRLIRVLSEHCQVICFQLRGEHDPILARRPHSLTDLVDDLANFQDALVLERPAVAGISFGSAIALEFAIRYSGRIGPLVLHGLDGHFRDSLGGRIVRLALEHFPLPHDNPFFNQFFRMLFARRESVGPLLDYVANQCWNTDQSVIAHRLSLLAAFDVRDRLKELHTPTLVIAGQDDSIVSPAAQQTLASSIPNAQFVSLPDSGHLCFLTRPQAFARHVTRFLSAVRSAALT